MIEVHGLTNDQRYGDKLAVDDLSFTVRPGPGHRVPGTERGRQVDHHAADPGAGRPDPRVGDRQRPAVPPAPGALAGGGGTAGGTLDPPRAQRLPPPAGDRPDRRHRPLPGGRGHRVRRRGRTRGRAGAQHRPGGAGRPAPLGGGDRLAGRRRRPGRDRPQHRPGRPRRRSGRDHPARADRPAGLPRGGLHGPDPGRGRVPRPHEQGRTAMTSTRPTTPARPADPRGQRVTQARVIRSEWTKLRSVPSTAWSLLAAVALIVAVGALYSLLRVTRPPSDPAAVASFDPTAVSLAGVQLAELAVGV